jgi:hypothetical protein
VAYAPQTSNAGYQARLEATVRTEVMHGPKADADKPGLDIAHPMVPAMCLQAWLPWSLTLPWLEARPEARFSGQGNVVT